MKKLLSIGTLLFRGDASRHKNRFPKPDFESGYQYPELHYAIPNETLWVVLDLFMLVLLMSIVVWAVYKKHTRKPIFWVSVISVAYFGFFRSGCVCSIGSIQKYSVGHGGFYLSFTVDGIVIFYLANIICFLFGRVFCAGVCPFGALQELVNVKNYRISKAVTATLGIIPLVISYIRRFIRCDEKPFYHLSVRPVYWYLPFRRRCGTLFCSGPCC